MPLPIDTWADRGGFPQRPVVTWPDPNRPDLMEIQVPTETGDLAVIGIRRRWPGALDHNRDEYSFEFSGELADVAPEGLTAMIQVAFLALREQRRFELNLTRVAE